MSEPRIPVKLNVLANGTLIDLGCAKSSQIVPPLLCHCVLPRNYGFPDLVLWRPKLQRRRGAHPLGQSGQPASWRGKEFGLGWEGVGQGWEVKVVEVKSVTDQLSMVQRAWLSALRDAGVPATVCRVAHLAPPKRSRKKN